VAAQELTWKDIAARCTPAEGDCLLWSGADNGKGHGKITLTRNGRRRNMTVRRYVWELRKGKLAPGQLVTVTCEHANCVVHLAATTKSEAARKGNAPLEVRIKRSRASAQTNQRKLGKASMQIAREIRASPKSGKELALERDISESLVSKIRHNRAWKDYSNPFTTLLVGGDAARRNG
jgi:hypothetical protein